jgi:RNase H-fold protein (predicted Holliday junction resolvase)
MAQEVERFAQELATHLSHTHEKSSAPKCGSIPILFVDERLSSREAEVRLKEIPLNRKARSEKLDSVAAMVLLEAFLARNQ